MLQEFGRQQTYHQSSRDTGDNIAEIANTKDSVKAYVELTDQEKVRPLPEDLSEQGETCHSHPRSRVQHPHAPAQGTRAHVSGIGHCQQCVTATAAKEHHQVSSRRHVGLRVLPSYHSNCPRLGVWRMASHMTIHTQLCFLYNGTDVPASISILRESMRFVGSKTSIMLVGEGVWAFGFGL